MRDKDQILLEDVYQKVINNSEEYKQIANQFVQNNQDLFQYHNLNYILKNKRSIKDLVSIKDIPKSVMLFLNELSEYQSNHYGNYNDTELYKFYFNLPDIIKLRSSPKKEELNQIYRGDSGKNEKAILSFAAGKYSKENVKLFGNIILSLSDLKSYKGIIDLTKLRTALEKTYGIKKTKALTTFFEYGDDENEVLVFGGKWK
jgi:hypothetical protein